MISKTEIIRIINNQFKFTPAFKAAAMLYAYGVRAETLHEMKTGCGVSDPIRVAIFNELQNIERE